MKHTILISLLFWSFTLLNGQEKEESYPDTTSQTKVERSLSLIGKIYNGNICLRWAPNNYPLWEIANSNGYVLELKKVKNDSLRHADNVLFKKVSSSPIKPWPLDDWKIFSDNENKLPLVAAQAIYGKQQSSSSNYLKVEEEMNNKFGLALLAADFSEKCAEASALSHKEYFDADYTYFYKLYVSNVSKEISSDTVYYKISKRSAVYRYPPEIVSTEENDLNVTLTWKDVGQSNSGFYIEKSSDGINFTRLNDIPFIQTKTNLSGPYNHISFTDSIKQNYVPRFYRIAGIDGFAHLSPYSDTLKLMGRDKTSTSPPRKLSSTQEENMSINLSWEWEAEMKEEDLSGFDIYHSTKANGYFTKLNDQLLSPDTRNYQHKQTDLIANYYFVSAIDTASNEVQSLRHLANLIDTTPPDSPTGLNAIVDSSGYLLLRWNKSPEADVANYKVYFSNDDKSVFTARSTKYLGDTLFLDSLHLKTLTEEIYYKVTAIDFKFNESDPSEILKVMKPDIVAPTAPVMIDYKNSEESIEILFNNSKSHDVVKQKLFRKTSDKEWELLAELSPDATHYIDNEISENIVYKYKLQSEDDANNLSEYSSIMMVSLGEAYYLKSIDNLSVSKNEQTCELNWNYEDTEGIYFLIYRKSNDGKLTSYKKVENTTEFIDDRIKTDTTYSYAIKVKSIKGKESKLSTVVSY